MTDDAILVEGLGKKFELGEFGARHFLGRLSRLFSGSPASGSQIATESDFWALQEIGFTIAKGERVGLIGRNGAGKSTLLRILAGISEPSTGWARIDGRVSALLEVGTGFHTELTGRENIYLNGAILGLSRKEITEQFDSIVDFAGVEKFLDTPLKRYSSGMSVRLAFAVASHLRPEIMLVDEVLAVGDAEFRRKCLGQMEKISESGRTILFVSHNLSMVSQLCDRSILLDHGRVVADGPTEPILKTYFDMIAVDTGRAEYPVDETKKVQVTALSVANAGEEPSSDIDAGKPFHLVIETLAHQDVSGTINIQLSSSHGARVCHSIAANSLMEYTQFRAGERLKFTLELPAGLFSDGSFYFNCWVVSPEDLELYDRRDSHPFSLFRFDDKDTFVAQRKTRSNLLSLPLNWTKSGVG